jgi:hypothetical protein
LFATAHGAKGAQPRDFIPEFDEPEDGEPDDPEEAERMKAKEEELQAKLRAADQRALLAGLMAMSKK